MSHQANCSYPDSVYSSSNKPVNATLKADISELESKHNSHDADATIHFLASTVWPIGSIFISTVSTNPATSLGFGTWTAFGAGKTLIGLNSGDADFDTAEETGGAKTVTLAEANLAAHTHTGPSHTHTGTTGNESADHAHSGNTGGRSADHTHNVGLNHSNSDSAASEAYREGAPVVTTQHPSSGASADHTHAFTSGGRSAAHTHNITTAADGTGATGSAGSATAFSVMNPYIVTYFFKRVS